MFTLTNQRSIIAPNGARQILLPRATLALRPRRMHIAVRAANGTKEEQRKKELIGQIEKSLKETGLDQKTAKAVLKGWSESVGHEITPEDLRKILVGQSTKAIILVLINTLFDAGAAYGAFVAGNFLGLATEQYGTPALIGQAIAYVLAGYYVTGAVFDLFKLGAVSVARFNFSVNSGAFLEAVEDIAGAGTGLDIADKAIEAVNSVKVLKALNTMADLLKESEKGPAPVAASAQMLADLGAYLTLSKAQKLYGFEAGQFGLDDEEAAEIAVIFGKYDLSKCR